MKEAIKTGEWILSVWNREKSEYEIQDLACGLERVKALQIARKQFVIRHPDKFLVMLQKIDTIILS